MNALRGGYALLRIPLPRLQQEILSGHDSCPTRQRKDQVPEVRRRQSRTAVGRFLRDNFKEELNEISNSQDHAALRLASAEVPHFEGSA
jgi:hypothetical protein